MSKVFDEIFINTYIGANISKGSFIVGTGTNSTYLPVGTNTQFLKANSATTPGVAWTNITMGSLADVTTTGITTSSILQYSGTIWGMKSESEFITFGTSSTYAASEGTSSTTSTTLQNKVTLIVPSLISSYRYRLGWYAETNFNDTSTDAIVNIRQNTSTVLGDYQLEPKDSGGNQWTMLSGFVQLTGLSGTNTFTLDYASSFGGDQISIRRGRLEFFRVA